MSTEQPAQETRTVQYGDDAYEAQIVGDSIRCPKCKADDETRNAPHFDSERGLKIHMGREHGGTHLVTVECWQCASDFQAAPAQDSKFCSRDCYREFQSGTTEHDARVFSDH
jgi:hypothetical protein